jgi:hypothetical protein
MPGKHNSPTPFASTPKNGRSSQANQMQDDRILVFSYFYCKFENFITDLIADASSHDVACPFKNIN